MTLYNEEEFNEFVQYLNSIFKNNVIFIPDLVNKVWDGTVLIFSYYHHYGLLWQYR